MDRKAWLDALLGDELVALRVHVRSEDVVFVKGVLEASEGLGAVFAEPRRAGAAPSERGGSLVIAAHRSREAELRRTIADLREDLGGALWDDGAGVRESEAAVELLRTSDSTAHAERPGT